MERIIEVQTAKLELVERGLKEILKNQNFELLSEKLEYYVDAYKDVKRDLEYYVEKLDEEKNKVVVGGEVPPYEKE